MLSSLSLAGCTNVANEYHLKGAFAVDSASHKKIILVQTTLQSLLIMSGLILNGSHLPLFFNSIFLSYPYPFYIAPKSRGFANLTIFWGRTEDGELMVFRKTLVADQLINKNSKFEFPLHEVP
uniref:Uncharacterized protein n=1 Tax=Micrurus lemniscatus lemniscatus TaxID=129467 RepID=A0A2D4IW65_MICLE